MSKSLVTGGAGFIGSHLVERLLNEGQEVRVLDDLSGGLRSNLAAVENDIEFIEGKIQDPEVATRSLHGINTVFHLAALGSVPRSVAFPMDTHEANMTGTLNLLIKAKDAGVEKFLFASSSSVYGDHDALPKSEPNTGNVLSPYALSKMVGENLCRLYWDLHGMQTMSFRFFNVFGPRQRPDHVYAAVIPRFLDAALAGQPLEVHGDGLQSRDFTYVSNNVDGIIAGWKALTPETAGRVLNLACEGQITLLDLIKMLEGVLGHAVNVNHIETRAGDIRHSFADTTALRSISGFSPVASVEQGLSQTLDWFKTTPFA